MNPETQTTTPDPDAAIQATLAADAAKRAANRPAKTPAAVKAAPAPKRDMATKVVTRADKKAAAKAAKAHKPSDIVSTEANPARSIVPVRFKQRYAEHGGTCGDKMALAVSSAIQTKNADGRTVLDMGVLKQIAVNNGIDYAAYEHLNNGQKSMNVRNRLRGLLKSGKKVTIGKQVFADAAKALAKPEQASV